jgi:hypothetical protein
LNFREKSDSTVLADADVLCDKADVAAAMSRNVVRHTFCSIKFACPNFPYRPELEDVTIKCL